MITGNGNGAAGPQTNYCEPMESIQTSEQLDSLLAALSTAQGELQHARADERNPQFNSRYADLAGVLDACRASLAKHGLSVIQMPTGDGTRITMVTRIGHSSGQWIQSACTATPLRRGKDGVEPDQTPQGLGSCITYLRRYCLAAMLGIAQEDDDGNAASARPGGDRAPKPRQSAPSRSAAPDASLITEEQQADLLSLIEEVSSDPGAALKATLDYYQLYAVGEIPAALYPRIVKSLKKKRA